MAVNHQIGYRDSGGPPVIRSFVNLFEKVRLFIDMKCLNCGKEIPEGRKFCSSSCAASYNNVRRERKPWTEEQKQKIRRPRKEEVVCKYCGKLGKTVCNECRHYLKLQLYRKLGIQTNKSLRECYLEAFEKLKKMYFEDKLSAPEIWKRTGVNFRTLRDIFNAEGLQTRTVEEGERVALEEGRHFIPAFSSYVHGYHVSWEGLKFFYRSSYELEYAKQLDEQKIPYRVENLRIRYFDTQKNKERVAVPDFYLPETNEIIEIKSTWTYNRQEMEDKFGAYRKAGYIPTLILDKQEV